MTKEKLANHLHDNLPNLSKAEAGELTNIVFEELKQALARGEKVTISGFATFSVRNKATRQGRNPQTGEPLRIPARRVVRFKASEILKKKMNVR